MSVMIAAASVPTIVPVPAVALPRRAGVVVILVPPPIATARGARLLMVVTIVPALVTIVPALVTVVTLLVVTLVPLPKPIGE
jgi:hypothetical protein